MQPVKTGQHFSCVVQAPKFSDGRSCSVEYRLQVTAQASGQNPRESCVSVIQPARHKCDDQCLVDRRCRVHTTFTRQQNTELQLVECPYAKVGVEIDATLVAGRRVLTACNNNMLISVVCTSDTMTHQCVAGCTIQHTVNTVTLVQSPAVGTQPSPFTINRLTLISNVVPL